MTAHLVQPIVRGASFARLEITGKCQLQCTHCYAESGPRGTDGAMTVDDWGNVIDQLAGRDEQMMQFIGGEPPCTAACPISSTVP